MKLFLKDTKNFVFLKQSSGKVCAKNICISRCLEKNIFFELFFLESLCSLRKGIRLKEFFWKDVIEKKSLFKKKSKKNYVKGDFEEKNMLKNVILKTTSKT